MLPNNICTTCGTQFPDDKILPDLCLICDDERQYINPKGQGWTNRIALAANHFVVITPLYDKLYQLKVAPHFAIGQRAFLALSEHGNILWDCIPILTNEAFNLIYSLGGIRAIAFSHPHYYSNMNEWAKKFNCPIYIHKADEEWIYNEAENIHLWDGERLELWDDISIVHIGGHFPGSCVLHLPFTPGGILLTGDTYSVAPSKKHISIMYSYPNEILLTRDEFAVTYARAKYLKFDTIYSAFEGEELIENAQSIFDASMQRYLLCYGL